MKVLFDNRWLGLHGIGRFAAELSQQIPDMTFLPDGPSRLHPLQGVWLGRTINRLKPDVYFSPGFNPPINCRIPFVFTIHDLILIHFKDEATLAKRMYFNLVVRSACRHASRVLTVSEFSRGEIIEWSGVEPEKVVNVSAGVSPGFNPDGPVKVFDSPYFLFVGNHKPHKNIHRVLSALAASDLASRVKLVITGAPGRDLQALTSSLGIANSVVFVENIPEEELASYYRGAIGLVFPSLYEGFGLPALEAMACGTAVITSPVASISEVVGESALLVDPLDHDKIADAMRRLYFDRELRLKLSADGLMRSRSFDWNRTAQLVMQVLSTACQNGVAR